MIRCTLLSDGSSDRALIPIFEWSLWQLGVRTEIVSQFADLTTLRNKPKNLTERVAKSIELYPCEILFIHRDSEGVSPEVRIQEIGTSTKAFRASPPHVCIIPTRMLEAWLLASETAIRLAAGNPSGSVSLTLPPLQGVESIADPKLLLFDLLRTASERRGRKLQAFNAEAARTLISQYIQDFRPLRTLRSFQSFESDLAAVVTSGHFDTWI